jgi:hypothetical protein
VPKARCDLRCTLADDARRIWPLHHYLFLERLIQLLFK